MIHPNPESSSIPESDPQTALPSETTDANPQIIVDPTGLSPDEVLAGFERVFDRKAEELFMVVSKDKTMHFRSPQDPSKPWISALRPQAELVAKEVGGFVITVAEGIKLMFKQIAAQAKKKH